MCELIGAPVKDGAALQARTDVESCISVVFQALSYGQGCKQT